MVLLFSDKIPHYSPYSLYTWFPSIRGCYPLWLSKLESYAPQGRYKKPPLRIRSPLLAKYLLVFSPLATKMFQFTKFPLRNNTHSRIRVPISRRKSMDHGLGSTVHSVSLITARPGLCYYKPLGIPLTPTKYNAIKRSYSASRTYAKKYPTVTSS